jgi:hypothetical protein
MKPAILSLLLAAKLAAVAASAVAASAEGELNLRPSPLNLSLLTEPLSGGYRRKEGSSMEPVPSAFRDVGDAAGLPIVG